VDVDVDVDVDECGCASLAHLHRSKCSDARVEVIEGLPDLRGQRVVGLLQGRGGDQRGGCGRGQIVKFCGYGEEAGEHRGSWVWGGE